MEKTSSTQRSETNPTTLLLWRQSVERAIDTMRQRMAQPLSLTELAKKAGMSKYHFDRVFRELTGVRPFQFLAAMRLASARDLLVGGNAPVADVCFEVGYNSLGTFTRRFTALVGTSPQRLRRFSRSLLPLRTIPRSNPAPREGMTVLLDGVSPGFWTFAGAFSAPLPMGRPAACAFSTDGGPLVLHDPPASHYLLAVALPAQTTAMPPGTDFLVGSAGPDPIAPGTREVRIKMRPVEPTDPPIVAFLPLLLRERLRSLVGES